MLKEKYIQIWQLKSIDYQYHTYDSNLYINYALYQVFNSNEKTHMH